jgi:MFS family permease
VTHPTEQRRQLVILAATLVLAMSTWFSTAAVLGQLREAWNLSRTEASWLTIVVQLGFVVGAVVLAATNLADRIAPRRLILVGAGGAALANTLVVAGDSYAIAIVARALTGAFLAAVYPPSLKVMSSWYRTGRGFALGVMIASLTVGSALPHLLNAAGGLRWETTLLLASGLTLVGGLLAEALGRDGPYTTSGAVFDPGQLRVIVANRDFRLASAGYFGHMWELYAMWAWMAAFYGDVFTSTRAASLAAFAVIGAGGLGSVYAGMMSDRLTRSEAAALAMRWSASAVVDARYVGTALTLQLATGFVLTASSARCGDFGRELHHLEHRSLGVGEHCERSDRSLGRRQDHLSAQFCRLLDDRLTVGNGEVHRPGVGHVVGKMGGSLDHAADLRGSEAEDRVRHATGILGRGLPPEHLVVEGASLVGSACHQLDPADRPDLHREVRARLPPLRDQGKHRPTGVGDHAHSCAVGDLEGRSENLATGRRDLGERGIEVIDEEERGPYRRRSRCLG